MFRLLDCSFLPLSNGYVLTHLYRFSPFRCSSLFSVAAEWKPHMEVEVEKKERVEEREEGDELLRGRLQLFSLAGGASRTDLRGSANTLMFSKLSIPRARGTITDFILMYRCGEVLAAVTCNPLRYLKGLTSRIVKLMCVCSLSVNYLSIY